MKRSCSSMFVALAGLALTGSACSDSPKKSSNGAGAAGGTGGAPAAAGASNAGRSASGAAGTSATGGASGSAGSSVAAAGGATTGGAGGVTSAGGAGGSPSTGGSAGTTSSGGAATAGGSGGVPGGAGQSAGGATSGGANTSGAAGQGAGMGGSAGSAAGSGGAGAGGAGAGGSAGMGSTALGATPPMGWNSWNTFESNVSESLIKQVADVMVSSGMKDAGYQYVNIDDTWSKKSREGGKLVADATRFPGGIKALADYVHDKGLKLGIYGDRGTETCAGYPGSYGMETQDATTFASWGVDLLKYDNCAVDDAREQDPYMQQDYTAMGNALKATGRPILFSICAWWFHDWMPTVGHIWRTTTDIKANWSTDDHSIISLLDKNGGDTTRYTDASYGAPGIAQYAGPGHYNDPDMLEVGVGALTETENRSHFSLWALMAAPLIAGNDIRSMSTAVRDILINKEVIAVNQDPLGKQGKPISASTTLEVWTKQLTGTKTYAVLLFNRTGASASISVNWSDVGFSGSASVRDLWAKSDLGVMATSYSATVPSHGVVMLKVVGQ